MQNQAPKLVIMAAGMGSRFGGLKQMEPVDKEGHSIIDFSMYDARRAGFRDLVFIIKREHDALFRERIGNRMERFFNVEYVYQELTDIPAGCTVPEIASITGYSLKDVEAILDAHYLSRDSALAETAIRKLEKHVKRTAAVKRTVKRAAGKAAG